MARQHHQRLMIAIDHWHSINALRRVDALKESPVIDFEVQGLMQKEPLRLNEIVVLRDSQASRSRCDATCGETSG